jgi:hypothetical protein
MVDSDDAPFGTHTHLEMWKHYDNLRQQKFSGFLTANSILLAVAGLLFDKSLGFIVPISFLGVVVCVAWFLLLTRNTAYISYHRKKALKDQDDLWTPQSSAGSGLYRMLDCHIWLVGSSRNRFINCAITREVRSAQNLNAIHRSSINSWRSN